MFYEKFRVLLKGGMGEKTLLHTDNWEAATGRTWSKSAKEIKLVDGKSMEEAGHRVTTCSLVEISGGPRYKCTLFSQLTSLQAKANKMVLVQF